MKQQTIALKTLAMKARVYNKIRIFLYKQLLEKIPDQSKIDFFNEIFEMNRATHWELIDYKRKRKDQKKLKEKRLAAPPTKSMKKKLRRYYEETTKKVPQEVRKEAEEKGLI